VEVAEVRIHEIYSTGALSLVAAQSVNERGQLLQEWELWKEREKVEETPCVRVITAPPGITANRVRVELATDRIHNWQEIDAVELVGRDGSRQWASGAEASSSWGHGYPEVWYADEFRGANVASIGGSELPAGAPGYNTGDGSGPLPPGPVVKSAELPAPVRVPAPAPVPESAESPVPVPPPARN
jgi:hypothetical protein